MDINIEVTTSPRTNYLKSETQKKTIKLTGLGKKHNETKILLHNNSTKHFCMLK